MSQVGYWVRIKTGLKILYHCAYSTNMMAACCGTFRAKMAPLCFQLRQICLVFRLNISQKGESSAFEVYTPALIADILLFNEITMSLVSRDNHYAQYNTSCHTICSSHLAAMISTFSLPVLCTATGHWSAVYACP